MAERVRLGEERPVGIAVERDPPVSQRRADGVDVVGGGRGPVGAETVAEHARRTERRRGCPRSGRSAGRGSRSRRSARFPACRRGRARGGAATGRACGRSTCRSRSSRSPARPRRRRSGPAMAGLVVARPDAVGERERAERRVGALERNLEPRAEELVRADVLGARPEAGAGGRERRLGARAGDAGAERGGENERGGDALPAAHATSLAAGVSRSPFRSHRASFHTIVSMAPPEDPPASDPSGYEVYRGPPEASGDAPSGGRRRPRRPATRRRARARRSRRPEPIPQRAKIALIALSALAAGLGVALALIVADPPTDEIVVTSRATVTTTETETPTTSTITTTTRPPNDDHDDAPTGRSPRRTTRPARRRP